MKQQEACLSTAHPLATEAGMRIMRQGGNAVDAAIAVSFALGVVEPYASGLGGGGVMLISKPESAADVLDYRETAPMSGIISESESGIPGFVRGMQVLHEQYGELVWSELIEPAVQLAEEGYPANEAIVRQLNKSSQLDPLLFPMFFPNGETIKVGELIVQPLLARTLRSIQLYGGDWFYEGELADRMVEKIEGFAKSDFHSYKVQHKKPIVAQYAGCEMLTAPLPFGGVTLLQAIKMSEQHRLHEYEPHSSMFYHIWGECMAQCYKVRKEQLGDPDYIVVDVDELTKDETITAWVEQMDVNQLSRQASLGDVANTTHFVIMDASGMCVSATHTIGGFFTTGLSIGGFFMNNQLRNFTEDERSPNRPSPGKRPQSYVCPTIFRNEEQTLAIGAAGGKRIPLTLAMVIMRMLKQGQSIEEALAADRFFIDEGIMYSEAPLLDSIRAELEHIGYEVQHNPDAMFYGGVQALQLMHRSGKMVGAADPRRGGGWLKEPVAVVR